MLVGDHKGEKVQDAKRKVQTAMVNSVRMKWLNSKLLYQNDGKNIATDINR